MNNQMPYYAQPQSAVRQASLIQRVCYLLCTTLLVTAATAYWAASARLSTALFLPLMIGTFVCVLGINFTRSKPGIGLVLLYALSALEGLLMGPLLGSIVKGYTLGAAIIGEAAGLSALLVAGLGTYVWMTSKDFGYLGKMLFWGLIGLLLAGLLLLFANIGPMGHLLYAVIGAAIFVGFTLYDFSNIKLRYGPEDYVIATVSLYLDFLNLFLFLLQILMSVSGGSRRSE